MKISIITVCYNSASTIRDTFESILSQTYSNIEYIVIDGKSTDETISIIKEYENKFNGKMIWVSEHDDGLYDAMNKGIKLATGDVVGILNSDDVYYDEYVLERIIKEIQEKKTDTLYGNIQIVRHNDINKVVRVWKSSPFVKGTFKKGWHPPHPSFFCKKKIYDCFGLFDTSFKVSADFELMLRLLEKNHVSTTYYDNFIVKMRFGGESMGSIKRIILGNKNVLRAFWKNDISISPLYPFYRLIPKLFQFCK